MIALRRPYRFVLAALALGVALTTASLVAGQQAAPATTPPSAQTEDAEFARLVREWTTRPEFLSPLVDHLPVVTGVPTPRDVLGRHIGEPKKLAYYDEAIGYYKALDAASPHVTMVELDGKTDEGRTMYVVFVSSEETITNLDRYRGYLAALADPRRIDEAEARRVIAAAKPIYHLIGGLHSTETGPPEMLMELAYRLAVEDSPLVNGIRDHVIVSLTPVAEPDGRDRVVDWYYRHQVEITDERNRMPGSPYWGRYVFHDNNRDINYSQLTFAPLLRWYLEWHPPIMHDLHESVPFLYTFSGQAPQQPSLDPILYGELPWFANFEMAQLTRYGMPGVWTHGFVDMWSPGYLAFMSSNHNGMIRMYETFGNGGATTMKRNIARPGFGPAQTSREWYRPNPPYAETEWSIRNNTNYMQTAVLSALQLTSEFPEVVLENFYRKSRNAIEAGRTQPPHGFVVPAGQRDMTRVATLVNMLRDQGIEVGRTTTSLTFGEETFPAGSYLVKRDQPYGRLAKILLEKQEFPDASLRTYDDTGWTMGWMQHTEVKAVADKSVLDAATEPVDRVALRGQVHGGDSAGSYVVPHRGSNFMTTLRYRLKSLPVRAATSGFEVGERRFPAGSFIVATADAAARRLLRDAVEALGLEAHALSSTPDAPMHEVDLPRLAIYSTWGNTQEVGWVRHAFDRFEIPFDLIYKERVRKGDLRSAYDVIVVPNQGRTGKGLVFDIAPRDNPLAYTRTERFKYLGAYGESEDITGGMGLEGVMELQRFAEQGGVLMTLGQASFFPPEFGLTREINASRTTPAFYAPGPIVKADIRKPAHPIFYGYAETTVPVRWANGPLLQVPEEDEAQQVLMRYPGGDAGVMSGLMKGAAEIRNRPAIVDVPTGKGRIVLFAGNPCYRWQNHGEFNMLFNAVLHWNDEAAEAPKATQ
jgi:hypothetical protein